VIKYACPRCKKEVMITEANSKYFKFRVVCFNCVYTDWIDTINLKEIKDEKNEIKSYY
jgi:ribosomal protein S27AE